MTGLRTPICSRQRFDTNLPANGSLVVPLRVGLDTTDWVRGTLEVVVYQTSITGTLSSTLVAVLPSFTCEDGKQANYGSGIASLTVTAGTVSSTDRVLLGAQLTTPLTSEVTVVLYFVADANTAMSGYVDIEVYLVGRDA